MWVLKLIWVHLVVPLQYRDAVCGAVSPDRLRVITSPNAEFIPQPFYGLRELHRFPDGMYGADDFVQWPQMYSDFYPWMSIIRRPTLDGEMSVMWRKVVAEDFVRHGPPGSKMGTLNTPFLEDLEPVVDAMCTRIHTLFGLHGHNRRLHWWRLGMADAFARLSFPSTYGDLIRQVVCIQRFWLCSEAYVNWHIDLELSGKDAASFVRPVDTKFMGAITEDASIVQKLLRWGIPVWFLRLPEQLSVHDRLGKAVEVSFPEDIQTTGGEHVFTGQAGTVIMDAIFQCRHLYTGVPLADGGGQNPVGDAKKATAGPSQQLVQRVQQQRARPTPCKFFVASAHARLLIECDRLYQSVQRA